MAHAGSWFGLPEFGATEWLQSKLFPQKSYASSGGSNILGASTATQQPAAQTTVSEQPFIGPQLPTNFQPTQQQPAQQQQTSQPTNNQVSGETYFDTGRNYGMVNGQETRDYNEYLRMTGQQDGGGGAPAGPSAEELAVQQREQQARAEELAVQQREQQARGEIESGYSGYFNQLNAMLNEGLPGQQTAQQGIAESQYTQGMAGLGSQREEGMGLLGRQRTETTENQARNLRDIATNLKNSFMAGNIYLGARGAGDSSAANQYSYALSKIGSRQRGDVTRQAADIQREIGDREAKLQNIYTDQVNSLGAERDQKIMGVAQWFAEAQNQIREAKGRGELAKGQDLASLSQNLLNDAINNLNAIKQEESNRRGMLEEWALNNASTIQQARSQMTQSAQFSPQQPQAPQGIVGQPQVDTSGNMVVPGYNYRNDQDEERNGLFKPLQYLA